jgi:hypothetical protein
LEEFGKLAVQICTHLVSGAEVTALQTLPRPPDMFAWREAFGLRRVHRRFTFTPGLTNFASIVNRQSSIVNHQSQYVPSVH